MTSEFVTVGRIVRPQGNRGEVVIADNFSAASLLFALPHQERWRSYTAELEGRIVSFGSMLIDHRVAHVGLDGTVADARCRGCNGVLLRKRILASNLRPKKMET